MNRQRRSDVAIVDPETVAEIAEMIHQAAPEHGVSQPTMSRLRNGKLPNISRPTFDLLMGAAFRCDRSGELRSRLFDATLPPGGATLWMAYRDWAKAAWGEFLLRRNGRWRLEHGLPVPEADAHIAEKDFSPGDVPFDLSGIAAVRWANYLALSRRVDRLPVGAKLSRFIVELHLRFDDEEWLTRVPLARFRIVQPLLDGPESGFVERSWEELTDEELTTFVEAGISRERILLNRPAFQKRARAAIAGEAAKPQRRRIR